MPITFTVYLLWSTSLKALGKETASYAAFLSETFRKAPLPYDISYLSFSGETVSTTTTVSLEKWYLLPWQFVGRNGTYYHDSREVWYLLPWQSGDMVPTTMTVGRNGTYYQDSLSGEMVPTTMTVSR